MSLRNLLLVITLVLGVLLAGLYVLKYGKTAPTVAAVPVNLDVVATSDLSAGALIKQENLAFVPAPKGASPDIDFERSTATDRPQPSARDVFNQIIGAVVRHRIDNGAPIPRDAVVKPGDSGFLAAVLAPGMQAITIGVTAVSGAGGLIYPGDRVDVILTQSFGQGDDVIGHRSGAEPIVRNVRVLAIDQQLQTNASQIPGKLAQTVTVEVTPQQAEAVALATKLGDLSLSIRSLLEPGAGAVPEMQAKPIWAEDISPALSDVEQQEREGQYVSKPPQIVVFRGSDESLSIRPDITQPKPQQAVTNRVTTVTAGNGKTVLTTTESQNSPYVP